MDQRKDTLEPALWCDDSYKNYAFDHNYSAPVGLTSSNLLKFQHMVGPMDSKCNIGAPPICIDIKGGPASDTSSVTAPDTIDQADDLNVMALGRLHLDPGLGRYGGFDDTGTAIDENFPESSHDLDIPSHDILEYESHSRYQLRSTAPPFEPISQHGGMATYGDSYPQYLTSPPYPPPQSAAIPRTAIPPHLMAGAPLSHNQLMQHQQQYDPSRARPQRPRELPFPMIKSNSDNRVLGNASRAAASNPYSQRPSSATSRMVSLPRPPSAMSGITTTAGSSVEMEETPYGAARRAYYSPLQAAQTPPPPPVPLRVLSLDVNQSFASASEDHTAERNSIYKFIEHCGAQVILMNNTGLGDEEQLRVVRNEVKTTYHTESAMWASFKTDGEDGGRGVAVLILGPLAPRTGWIRSDSRGHILSASSRVKPGLPVLSFVACDLGVKLPPDAESSVEALYSSHIGALREMMHSEQEKGAYIVAGGSIKSNDYLDASAYNFSDLGIHSLHNRMKLRSGSPDGVETAPGDDIFVSLHTKTDDPFGIKISSAEVVERSFDAYPGISSLVAITVGGWPQDAFFKQKGGNKSPDTQSPNRKSRSRPSSGSKVAAGGPPRYMMHHDGPRAASPHSSSSHSQFLETLAQYRPSPPMGREPPLHMAPPYSQHRMSPTPSYDRTAHMPQRPVPVPHRGPDLREAAHVSSGPRTDSISTINELLSWRMNVMDSLNSLERILTSTQWGVVRLDQLKRLVQNILFSVDDMPHRVGTPGFADAASISVLKSFNAAAPEKLLQSGPEILSQILKTWHASTDHTIHRISS